MLFSDSSWNEQHPYTHTRSQVCLWLRLDVGEWTKATKEMHSKMQRSLKEWAACTYPQVPHNILPLFHSLFIILLDTFIGTELTFPWILLKNLVFRGHWVELVKLNRLETASTGWTLSDLPMAHQWGTTILPGHYHKFKNQIWTPEAGEGVWIRAWNTRMRQNGFKLKEDTVRWDIGK